jgi:glutathione S-transferase
MGDELPTIYGAAYSVYVQAVRLCLEEKGVSYRMEEVDVFAPGGPPPEHLSRHPFGRIPAFAHAGVTLYETAPICRYIDEAFQGPTLQPATPVARARMGQAIAVADNYAYSSLVWGLYVETVEGPAHGRPVNRNRVEAATKSASTCLCALEDLAPKDPWLAGPDFSLADLHVAPMFSLFLRAPAAAALLAATPRISAWFERMIQRRPAMGLLNRTPT